MLSAFKFESIDHDTSFGLIAPVGDGEGFPVGGVKAKTLTVTDHCAGGLVYLIVADFTGAVFVRKRSQVKGMIVTNPNLPAGQLDHAVGTLNQNDGE